MFSKICLQPIQERRSKMTPKIFGRQDVAQPLWRPCSQAAQFESDWTLLRLPFVSQSSPISLLRDRQFQPLICTAAAGLWMVNVCLHEYLLEWP